MALHIVLITEILSIIFCIHSVYGKKVMPDAGTLAFFLCIVVVLEMINYFQMDHLYSFLLYGLIFLYCKWEFRENVVKTVGKMILALLIITLLEFLGMVIVGPFVPDQNIRILIINLFIWLICVFLLPNIRLSKYMKSLREKSRIFFFLVGVLSLLMVVLLVQMKVFEGIWVNYFLLFVILFVLSLVLWKLWLNGKGTNEELEKELNSRKENEEPYQELITKVRMRQHEMNNHITAVYSMHHTNKTYEELVKAQEEYCEKIAQENKYNYLLALGNGILIGFLYKKFQEMEKDRIQIEYHIALRELCVTVPEYYMIEMLGILLNNAAEAQKDRDAGGRICVDISECDIGYQFEIKNPFSYVPFDEIENWFLPDVSSKGQGRGLGLYHLIVLCTEWDCDVTCKNSEADGENWICFTLVCKKEDC